jgi:hypothetical protein
MKNYVGRKIRGFRFEDGIDGIDWMGSMKKHIGEVGEIISQHSNQVLVTFLNNSWGYPISLIEQHLIEEENNANQTSLVKCGYCNKHYRCTTCGAICGTEGHYVEKEPHLIEETPEIPQLGEGILMKVSDDGVNYKKTYVIAILSDGRFLDRNKLSWKLARPIPQLPKYTHAELVEKLGEDFEYGGK